MSLPKTMRAIIHNQKTSTLSLNTIPLPTPNFDSGEHLLKVHTVALTRWELLWPRPPPLDESYTPGVECCGTVITAPPVSAFPPGTKVYFRTTYPRTASLSTYTLALASELAPTPSNLSDEECAAVPVSALTAWQGLFTHAGLSFSNDSKKRILVNGAAGSVGLWYVQLASAAGMDVVGTCKPSSAERVRAAGARSVVDYTTTDLREYTGPKFDVVFDCVGGASLESAWHVVKGEGGLVLSIVPPRDMNWKFVLDRPEGVSERVEGRFFVMESKGADLAEVTKLIERGKVRPLVDSVFGLEEFMEAFERADGGRTEGKVVVRVDGE